MIIDKSLRCPWNKFKKCWEHLCPYYGLTEKREKEAGKFDIINGCKRVSKEKEAQK